MLEASSSFTIDFQAHLCGILGEVLEHQFLCEHQPFNKRKEFLDEIRKNIIKNLDQCFLPFSSLAGQELCTIADTGCKSSLPPGTLQLHITACTYVPLHVYSTIRPDGSSPNASRPSMATLFGFPYRK